MAHTSSSVTLADIARLSGVGIGTASRALSNAPGVATNTRQRVLAVAEELHYVVSPDASALAKGATGRIGLLVPHLSRWHFGAVVEGLNEVLRDADLDVLLYQVGNMEDRARFFKRLPPRRKVDALVVIGFPVAEDERRRLELMGVHIVTVAVQAGRAPLVHIDDYAAGRRAVDYLVNLGHRRIAMIEATDPDLPGLVPQRSVAYYEALDDAGIAADLKSRCKRRLGRRTGFRVYGWLTQSARAADRRVRAFRRDRPGRNQDHPTRRPSHSPRHLSHGDRRSSAGISHRPHHRAAGPERAGSQDG